MHKNELKKEISSICRERINAGVSHTVIAIDGRCASGKTTLAGELAALLENELSAVVNIIHMDDFFLRPEQRTEKRLATPGENVDHERFLDEVLIPLHDIRPISYRPFSCHDMALSDETVSLIPGDIDIVEGSYSCHPKLYGYYDFRIFCDIDKDTQLARIINREESAAVAAFQEKWIPMEESYFDVYDIKRKCDYIID